MESLTISQFASAARVHIETVRYYQRRGLLPMPPRPERGIRRYGPKDVARLQFIRRAQAMGFSLEEVGTLLALKGRTACEETLQLTLGKLAEVRTKQRELQQIEADLVRLVAGCESASWNGCPTLELLELPSKAVVPLGT
jgi:MerR family mercuric resistance operon transcriptional regulator